MNMTRFNLKAFIEDFIIAKESNDLDSEQDLLNSFNKFFDQASEDVRRGIRNYLFKSPIVKQYSDLQDIITKCEGNF